MPEPPEDARAAPSAVNSTGAFPLEAFDGPNRGTMEDKEIINEPIYEKNFIGHKDAITALSFHPNGDQLISSSLDKKIILWHLKKDKPAYKFMGHKESILDVCYSPHGDLMASASKDRSVRIWTPKIKGHSSNFVAHSSAVTSIQFSPNGEKLVTASNDKTIKVWLTHEKTFFNSFVGHTHWVMCVKFSPDGRLLVSCSDDKTIKVWDNISGLCIKTYNQLKAPARYVDFHPSGATIGSANVDGCVKLYDLRTDSVYQRYNSHKKTVNMIKFHPKGHFMLTASSDSTMKILDLLEGRPIYTLKGPTHKTVTTSIAFSNDGEFFASGGTAQQILLWKFNLYTNVQNGEIPKQLISPIIREKSDDVDEKLDSNEHNEDAHKKQNQAKCLSNTSEKLDSESDSSQEPLTRQIKPEVINIKNIKPIQRTRSKRDVANVHVPQGEILHDVPSNQSMKKIDVLCDQVQLLHQSIHMIERRLIRLEERFHKLNFVAYNH
ncbi:POC1 centriolar protein homolog A isoform X1 [Solenopsis invicta]|uniref:POC1 centriolar protein homolog A isoform X1 n=2 Tax=Solenopsis invicta TaxID=13686 RepID=UPI00193DB15B|nr:POC1 centriolar protein homolog A isoform X1 [Solenopsis invicta]